jgi:hypothetical protein
MKIIIIINNNSNNINTHMYICTYLFYIYTYILCILYIIHISALHYSFVQRDPEVKTQRPLERVEHLSRFRRCHGMSQGTRSVQWLPGLVNIPKTIENGTQRSEKSTGCQTLSCIIFLYQAYSCKKKSKTS